MIPLNYEINEEIDRLNYYLNIYKDIPEKLRYYKFSIEEEEKYLE